MNKIIEIEEYEAMVRELEQIAKASDGIRRQRDKISLNPAEEEVLN